jgi:hypothetical protein
LAGTNKALKAGTVVFKAGDSADGMYIVRKGELVVYFEQGGKEVILAKIPEGGMVGEMALFDRMPRSASVKASLDSEITHISLDDFTKLMKQIPKWFVTLMGALSSRLRVTNDRLKSIEAAGGTLPNPAANQTFKPYRNTLKMLHTMELLWHRDGLKEGKEWNLPRKTIEDELTLVFGDAPQNVKSLLDLLCAEGILVSKLDSYRAVTISMPNRAALSQFAKFVTSFTKANPNIRELPDALPTIMKLLVRFEAKSPYNQFTVSLEELTEAAAAASLPASNWGDYLPSFNGFGDTIKPVKTSTPSGLGLRVMKGELATLARHLAVFQKLSLQQID